MTLGRSCARPVRKSRKRDAKPEQLGDAHPRQQGVERPVDRLGRLRRRSGNGRHVQPAALEADSLQPTAAEQTGEPLEPLLELFSAPGQVAVDVTLDG
jgi:hypothetical protein